MRWSVLRWGDIDLDRRVLWVRQSVVQVGYDSVVGTPKTARGETVGLIL